MSDHSGPLLQMRGITKSFGATQALKGIDLTLDRGEVLGLIGENGAGKSTIIKILSGAYHKDAGEILLDGTPVAIGSPKASQQLGISTIYQELTLFPDLDAVENILIGREPCRPGLGQTVVSPLDRRRMRREAAALLEQELGVSIDLGVPVRYLSLAEKQLIEIARSLYSGAEIIIMDEPTEALESAEREHLFTIIGRLSKANRAVIYVSHLLDELIRVASRVMVLRDGARVATQPVEEVTVATIISQMIGRELEQKYADKPVAQHEVILQVEGAGRSGRFQDVSFDLRRGQILGIAGLDGSGKKDLVRSLFQAAPLDTGLVELGGHPLPTSINGAKRAGLGLMPGDRKSEGLFLDKSLEWNVTIADIGNSRRSHLPIPSLKVRTRDYIESMSIRTRGPSQPVKDLSGGNQQKGLLARWLVTRPQVLVLEEPTRGVDIRSKAEIYHQITAAAAEGMSFIIVSADSPELLGLCHRVLVMHSGRVVADLDADSADEETIAHYSVQTTGATS